MFPEFVFRVLLGKRHSFVAVAVFVLRNSNTESKLCYLGSSQNIGYKLFFSVTEVKNRLSLVVVFLHCVRLIAFGCMCRTLAQHARGTVVSR